MCMCSFFCIFFVVKRMSLLSSFSKIHQAFMYFKHSITVSFLRQDRLHSHKFLSFKEYMPPYSALYLLAKVL